MNIEVRFGAQGVGHDYAQCTEGTTGDESWVETPYNEKLASFGKGYDICWANLPDKALGDIQLSAEYLAHGIKYLAQRSPASSHRIHVLGHSQGGVNVFECLQGSRDTQALRFPFQGIEVSALRCPATKVFRTCVPAVLQLMADSKFMAALNSNKDSESGARALVPTTSIFSDYDLIIRLEGKNLNVSSWLSGATMIKIQNSTVCGKEHFTEHFEIMVDQAVFGLVSDAILHERPANISNFNEKLCHGQVKNLALNLHQVPKVLKAMFYSYFGDHKLEWFWNPYSHLALAYEPKLQ
ncbi:hypothetical protein O181_068986, partial [Austropuccinia psidii MF-1]|nr:hypothetical protein [Austropuccinia psidii MF-1]